MFCFLSSENLSRLLLSFLISPCAREAPEMALQETPFHFEPDPLLQIQTLCF